MNNMSDTAWFVWYFSQANCCFYYNPALAQKDETTGKINSRVKGCSDWNENSPITDELARQHLEEGSIGVGTPTTDGQFAVKFAALDYDSWDLTPRQIAERIKEYKLRGVVCRTRSGRARVFLPFVEPIEIELAFKMMCILRDEIGLPEDPHVTEIFPGLPKKNQLLENFIKGSNLWLPYRKGSDEVAIDPETGDELSFSAFREMWEGLLCTRHMVETWVKHYARAQDQSGSYDVSDSANDRVAKMLADRCETFANMKDGEGRNTFLYVNSRVFFGYAANGYIEDDAVEEAFSDAAAKCGLDHNNVKDVLRRAKKSGHAAPLKFKKERKRKGKDNIDDEEGIKLSEDLTQNVNDAEMALLASDFRFYKRAGKLVRTDYIEVRGFNNTLTRSWCLVDVTLHQLIEKFNYAVKFWKLDQRSGWHKVICPKQIAETYMNRVSSEWRAPILLSIVNVPVLMSDGTFIDKPGLNTDYGIFYEPQGVDFGKIHENPTREDALVALRRLLDLVSTFPFVSDADRSVAIAMYMTAVLRPALPTAPMFGVSAYEAGSGKTKLAEMAGCIANGRATPATNMSRNDEEFEKGLKSAFLAGRSIVAFDNLDRPLESGFLCTALTAAGEFPIRGFGTLQEMNCLNTATVIGTGNNLEVKGDLIRRTIICALDPGEAHPEKRKFNFNPVERALEQRVELVRAIFIIARAYQLADRLEDITPLGNFEEWSQMVREPLIWLGMVDPCRTGERIEKFDKDTNNLREVIERWPERNTFIGDPDASRPGIIVVRTKEFSTRELINWCKTPNYRGGSGALIYPPLLETFLNIAPSKRDGEIDAHHLGNWFRKRKGKFVGKDRLMLGETKDNKGNTSRWVIERHLSLEEYSRIMAGKTNGHAKNGGSHKQNDEPDWLPGLTGYNSSIDGDEETVI